MWSTALPRFLGSSLPRTALWHIHLPRTAFQALDVPRYRVHRLGGAVLAGWPPCHLAGLARCLAAWQADWLPFCTYRVPRSGEVPLYRVPRFKESPLPRTAFLGLPLPRTALTRFTAYRVPHQRGRTTAEPLGNSFAKGQLSRGGRNSILANASGAMERRSRLENYPGR